MYSTAQSKPDIKRFDSKQGRGATRGPETGRTHEDVHQQDEPAVRLDRVQIVPPHTKQLVRVYPAILLERLVRLRQQRIIRNIHLVQAPDQEDKPHELVALRDPLPDLVQLVGHQLVQQHPRGFLPAHPDVGVGRGVPNLEED